jgi:hypothetical protein
LEVALQGRSAAGAAAAALLFEDGEVRFQVLDAALQPLAVRALARSGVGTGAVGRWLAHTTSESQARPAVRPLFHRTRPLR